jgi:hypothetical protein
LFLGGCTTPVPSRAPGTPPPAAEPSSAGIPEAGPWHFTYAYGSHRFEVRNDAIIEATESGIIDSVTSLTYISYTLRPRDDEVLVTGSIDSFVVTPADSITAAGRPMAFPIYFSARMDDTGHIREFSSPDTSSCGSAAGALLGIARDLLVAVPSSLLPGSEWEDSTSSVACRGDIPITVATVRRHRLDSGSASTGLLRILRQSELDIVGTGTRRVQTTTVRGRGQGTMEIFLDPANGVFRGAAGESLTELTFDAASRRERFRQHVRLQIRLLEPFP